MTEHGPNKTFYSGLDSTRETRMAAVIELDGSADDGSSTIIGGEYLDDPSIGANRLKVAPFVWLSTGPGPESSWSGRGHNPHIKTSVVSQLIKLGSE